MKLGFNIQKCHEWRICSPTEYREARVGTNCDDDGNCESIEPETIAHSTCQSMTFPEVDSFCDNFDILSRKCMHHNGTTWRYWELDCVNASEGFIVK
jgi:hypothetical protein